MITAEQARFALAYDPETGRLTWRVKVGRSVVGSEAGYIGKDGYRLIGLYGREYPAHRLAYLIVTGEHPPHDIDHRNGARGDNAWLNLRPATRGQNHQNRARSRNNTSGFTGVSWHKGAGKWSAQIKDAGRVEYLGLFPTAEAASAAYQERKRALHTFHPEPVAR